MKSRDIRALHDQTLSELATQLEKLLQELAQVRIEKAAGKLSNVSKVQTLQDDIARVKTVLTEKKNQETQQVLIDSDKA